MAMPDKVRYFNKRVTNRVSMKIAGAPHSPFSIVRHVGRRSGKPYETPVIVEPVKDGFVFALTYGPDVDWYRNVLAAGRCGLRWHGKEYQIESPETLDPKTGRSAFPPFARSILRLLGIQHFMQMKYRSSR